MPSGGVGGSIAAMSGRENGEDSGTLQRLIALAGLGVVRVSSTGNVIAMDAAAKALLGHALLPLESRGETSLRVLTVGQGGERPWEAVLEHGEQSGMVYGVRDAAGKLDTVVFDGFAQVDSRGEREVVLLVRRSAREASTMGDPYRSVYDEVSDGIVVHDIETGAIVDMNRRAAELHGWGAGEAPPGRPHETATQIPPEEADSQAFARMLRAAAGESQVFEWPVTDREGRLRMLEVSLKRARIGTHDRLLAVVRDITKRKATEQALRASEERYRAFVEATHDIIWALDTEGNFTFVNRRGEDLTGYRLSEWQGKSFAPIVFPEDLPKAHDAYERAMRGERVRYEVRVVDTHGRVRRLQANVEPLREDGRIVGMVGLGTDITERTRMEDELHKAQKLESLGLLAGGIAHDFNNILTAIVGGIALARRSMGQPTTQQETLEMAEKACLRARELTQQLLTFSRGGAPIRKPASVAELLEETAQFALRGSNVRCHLEVEEDLRLVEMDAGQMSQVLNNLLINAAQAMPHGGTVTLRAENFELQTPDNRLPTLRPGLYVRVCVRDEGDGIPREHLPNIFDPYFTTKPSGTGLGLATCYSIVKRHDGTIDVKTAPGQGTTFRIYLPSTERELPLSEAQAKRGTGRGGTVLVMDDDPMVRSVGSEMLRMLGYSVVAVSDGRQALRAFREALAQGRSFEAIILDLTVPGGMGGREAAAALREIDPKAKLIASSGYSTDPIMADHKRYGFDGVVAKPYVPEDLESALGMVLRDEAAR
jgi:PAS domain S-box-containing protein